jgi:hypothetical protein
MSEKFVTKKQKINSKNQNRNKNYRIVTIYGNKIRKDCGENFIKIQHYQQKLKKKHRKKRTIAEFLTLGKITERFQY